MAISAEKIIRSPAANLLPVKHIPKRGKAFALKELEALIFADNGLKRIRQAHTYVPDFRKNNPRHRPTDKKVFH